MVEQKQFQQTRGRKELRRFFAIGDRVFVKNSREGPRWLEAMVTSRTGPVSYVLQVTTPRGVMEWKRHQDHIRPREADRETTSANHNHCDRSEAPWQPSESATGTEPCAGQLHDQAPAIAADDPREFSTRGDPEPPGSEDPDHDAGPSPGDRSSGTSTRSRYPTRERRPPDRYTPTQ